MAGQAQVIGKVAVKVIPDTKGFRKKAQAELVKQGRDLDVLVGAKIDENRLRAAALTAVNRVNNAIRGKDAYRVRFGAAFSMPDLRRAVNRAVFDLNVLARKEKIEFDADVAATIAEVEGRLNEPSMKRVERELKDWISDISPLEVDVMPTMLPGASSYVAARLSYLTRPRTVSIVPKIDNVAFAAAAAAIARLSGGRVVHDSLDGIWDRLKRIDKLTPIIGSLAEAIALLGAWGLTAASNLFALSMSLAQIGPAALTLPGILGGIAIGVGATVAVLKDFNDVLPEVADRFKALQDQMSEKFWAVAKQPMQDMIDTLFPQFAAGLKKTSTELGGFFANLSDSLSGKFNDALAGMFDDLSESIAIAAGHTDSFANILKVLGEVGAGYLPDLAGWFGKISDRFSNFLTRSQESGAIFDWIDLGIFQLKELGRATAEFGGVLAGLARAATAGGGSTLTMFADTLERMHNAIDGDKFQTALVGSLQAAHAAMSRISDGSGQQLQDLFHTLSQTAQTVFPMMGQTVGVALGAIFSALDQVPVQAGLVVMFEGLAVAVNALAPAMAPVALALGSLMGVVGELAEAIGPVLSVALTALAGLVTNLAGPVETLIEMLGGGLLSVVTSIAGPLGGLGETLATVFSDNLLPALKPVIDFIVQLASNVLPILIEGLGQVLVAIAPLIDLLGQLFEVVGPILLPALTFLAEVLVTSIVQAVEGAVQVITGFVDVLDGLWQLISGVFTGNWEQAWQGIQQIFSGIWDMIVGAFKVALNVGILGVAKKVLTGVKAFFKNIWDDVWKNLKGLWNNIQGSFIGFMNDLKNAGTTTMQAIKNFFRNIWNDIRAFFKNVWHGMKATVSGALSSIKSVVSGGFNAAKNTISTAMNGARNVVRTVWNAIKGFFSGGKDEVIAKVKELPSAIKGVFSNAGSILKDAGKQIIQGLIDGISSMYGKVKGKLGDLTSKLTSWKGPESVDRVLLHDAGRLVIDGFINGLESRYDAVRKSLKGLTAEVAATEFDAPAINGSRSSGLSRHLAAVVADSSAGSGANKTFNYYAAPGSSIDSEEDLFAAVNRARMVGW